jgi:hypothetical protein
MRKLFILSGFLIALGVCSPASAQVKELACPAGSSVAPNGAARDSTNDQIKENYCVDKTGKPIIAGPITLVGPCDGAGCGAPSAVTGSVDSTQIPVGSGTGSVAGSLALTSPSPGVLLALNSVATGATPPACVPGTSGAFCSTEGTAPTGAASVDMLYANAANHCLTAINNNVDVGCVVTSQALTVSGLGAAAAGNKGFIKVVSDSTTVSAEGQTCVGSSTHAALAFSDGVSWKCF